MTDSVGEKDESGPSEGQALPSSPPRGSTGSVHSAQWCTAMEMHIQAETTQSDLSNQGESTPFKNLFQNIENSSVGSYTNHRLTFI